MSRGYKRRIAPLAIVNAQFSTQLYGTGSIIVPVISDNVHLSSTLVTWYFMLKPILTTKPGLSPGHHAIVFI